MYYSHHGWSPQAELPKICKQDLKKYWKQSLIDTARNACTRVANSGTDKGWPWNFTLEHDFIVITHACRVKSATKTLIKDALQHVPRDASDPLLSLTALLKVRLADYKRSSRASLHTFAMPLRLSLDDGQPAIQLSLHDVPIWLCSRDQVSDILTESLALKAPVLPSTISHPILGNLYGDCKSIAIVQGLGHDSSSGWLAVGEAWAAARGILELSWGAFSFHLSWGVDPDPLARLRSPRGAFVLTPRGEWEHSLFGYPFTPIPITGQPPTLSGQALKTAVILAQKLEYPPSPGSVLGVWSRCMALYSQALEQPFAYAQLLQMWQCAECLSFPQDPDSSDAATRPSRRGDTGTVCKRLGLLFRRCAPNLPDVSIALGAIGDLRNDIVHRGHHEHVQQEHVNFLKYVLDGALIWTQANHDKFPTTYHFESVIDRLVPSEANKLRSETERIVHSLRAPAAEPTGE